MEKWNYRILALQFQNIKKIFELIEFVFAASFPQRHPTTSCNQLFCVWKCRALGRWQSITETEPEDEEQGDDRWCLKGFCLLKPKPIVSKVWWCLLINSKLQCSVAMFPLLLGDAVFLPLAAVDFVWWWERSGFQISHPYHLHSPFMPSQDHCPSPDSPCISFCHAVGLLQSLGLSLPPLISTPSPSWTELAAEWGAAWLTHFCCHHSFCQVPQKPFLC